MPPGASHASRREARPPQTHAAAASGGAEADGWPATSPPDPALGSDSEPIPSPLFQWLRDEREAARWAALERRAVLVDFFASWCPPCALLEQTTLRDPSVWAVIALDFVPLRIDVSEETGRTKELLEAFRIDRLPALLVIDASGREVDRLTSYLPAEPFAAWLRQAASRAGRRQDAASPRE
jgi:thiol-disulfide isomerase/thioredoxin